MINRARVSCESNMDNFRVIITKIGDKTSVVIEHCEKEAFDEDEFDEEDLDPDFDPEEEAMNLDALVKKVRKAMRSGSDALIYDEYYDQSTGKYICDEDCLEDRGKDDEEGDKFV